MIISEEPTLDRPRPPRRTALRRTVAVLVGALGLACAYFCYLIAALATFGFESSPARLDPAVVLPLVGVAVTVPLGPLVLSLGPHARRWRRVAVASSALGVAAVSLATWVPVALGLS